MSDELIELSAALQRCTGNTAEAEQTRRRLARELAAHLMRRIFHGELDEPELVKSALATLLGDTDPRLDYAPAWTIAPLDWVVHRLAGGAVSGDARQIVVSLQEYSRTITDLISRDMPDTSAPDIALPPDDDLW